MIALQTDSNASYHTIEQPVLRFRVDAWAKLTFLLSQTNSCIVCIGRGGKLDPWLVEQVSIPLQESTPTESSPDHRHLECDAEWRHFIQLGSDASMTEDWATRCPVNDFWGTRTVFNTESNPKSFLCVATHHPISFEIQNDIDFSIPFARSDFDGWLQELRQQVVEIDPFVCRTGQHPDDHAIASWHRSQWVAS